jgi:ABC-2 type transport system permease protein
LNKPISFIWYYFSQWFFKNLLNIVVIWIMSGAVIFIFLWRFPRFWLWKMVLFLITMLIWICMLSLVSLIISLFAFILEDSSFISLTINKLYFIFGWVFFPISIYPIRMQNISKFLPFQYYVYWPAKFFSTWDSEFLLSYLPFQILRLVLLILIVRFIYKRMLRNVEINGG